MHIVISSRKPSRTAGGMINIEVWTSANAKGSDVACADLRYRKDTPSCLTRELYDPAHDPYSIPYHPRDLYPTSQPYCPALLCDEDSTLDNNPPFVPDATGCLYSPSQPSSTLPSIFLVVPPLTDPFIDAILPPSSPSLASLAVPPMSYYNRLDEEQERFYFPMCGRS
ncbi:hypothetical protein OF83DRAFT_1173104 [Amylostereum chailletii]|nr:hypothetical protein OF83DRAFT_1173104 [Amylostereum chailletii]